MWLSVYQVLLSGSVALGKRLHLSGPQDQGRRLENHSAVVKNMASGARLCGFEFWLYHLATCDLGQVVSPPGEPQLPHLSSGDNSLTAFYDGQAK